MLIGILQCGHFPEELQGETGDYGALYSNFLSGYGFDFKVFSVCDGIFPDSATDCDGWLISGSKYGAYEDHAWIPRLEDLIRAIKDADRPLVGVCFGHQIIAQALGGTVEKFDGGWSVGRTIYRFDDREEALNAWHQDQVTALPDGARVLASSDRCAYAALAYGNRIYTIQPHPEFDRREVAGLLKVRGAALDATVRDGAAAALDMPVDNKTEADKIAAHFQRAMA
ncbi:type 1 glutamine amidotransferase [Pseudooceanicola onchidii]|uniref:type 1 glutamine amidotransferase n=1 Tax=Pseudooceanicola onchidii TaxID=2562279 RepID=UPI0010A9EF7E|nr:type 1 glutamine amidotransferase [Pseudooceanicola onchidii]